jgi:predicted Zn-dependent protease with MMP-like domain
LDEGRVESARIEFAILHQTRPGHPDLRIVDAALSIEEGQAERALSALNGAERSADPSLFFHLRALAEFELGQFERAREDAERALVIHPDLAEAQDLASRVYEHLGDIRNAEEHAAEACAIDPKSFPRPLEISDEEFDRLVDQSLRELPAKIRDQLRELPVLVEPLPRREILVAEHPPVSPDILGLFVGRNLLERTHSDPARLPGAIYLFRRNLLRVCATREELSREIRTTVQHEVGHLLGLDEEDLGQWGLA